MSKTKLVLASLVLFPLLASAQTNTGTVVHMTKNGFEPKEITVNQGEEVVFINEDMVNRWPASDFHPTHGIYPEFDPQAGVAPGQSWKFTFDKAGTWKMHDHLIPYMTGRVMVNAGDTSTTEEISQPKAGFWESIKNFFRKIFG